ncbi:MAG TPA: flagellar basal body P-ring formation chaperone FlgA [Burkholderiales bacterium]
MLRPVPAIAVLLALVATGARGADPVVEAARAHLERALAPAHEQVIVEPLPGRQAAPLPAGGVSLETRGCGRETPARRMCVWVDVMVDGARRSSVAVWFRVEAKRKVLVATDPVPADAEFDPRAFALELRDVAALPGAPLATAAHAGRLRVKRPLEPGQVVLERDVTPIPAVARNQEVTIRLQTGGILIEAPGVALSEGRVGATVRVRNPRSGEIYQARVVDDGVLAVTLR